MKKVKQYKELLKNLKKIEKQVEELISERLKNSPDYMFPVSEIKSGYVLETDDGSLLKVEYDVRNKLGASGKSTWFKISNLDDNLFYGTIARIDKIYGRAPNAYSSATSTYKRELLWKRYI